jgi:hypothetical protein
MRILTWTIGGLAGLIVLLLLIGLVLPAKQTVERSILIDAAPRVISLELNDLRRYNEWAPWSRRDPDMEIRFEGPDQGVGAEMYWKSETEGSGVLRIVASEENAFVVYELEFDWGRPARSRIDLEPERGAVRTTWRMEADFGWNIPGRWFGVFFDLLLGPDFQSGLLELKAMAEHRALDPFAD